MTKKNESRQQALAEGKKTYHGRPCKKCQNTKKYVSTWSCVACVKESTMNRDPEIFKKYIKSDKGQEWLKEYRKTSVYRGVQNKYLRDSGKGREIASRRRKIINQQYEGLNESQKQQISEMYAKAAQHTCDTGIMHHVDHIIPLWEGGTHEPENLQILTVDKHWKKCAEENKRRQG